MTFVIQPPSGESEARAATPSSSLDRKPTLERVRARAPVPDRVDVAVVGCGLGGLTAAAHLARSGMRVACFDAHYVAGGCATEFARGPRGARYHFDVGVHYVGDCGDDGEIPRMLRACGIDLEFAELDPDGFDTIVFPGLRFRVPAGVDRFRDRLVEHFPEERRGVDKYIALVRSLMRAGRALGLKDGKPGFFYTLPFLGDALRVRLNANATIGELLDDWIRDPRLKALLVGQCGDYGLPPSRVSAILHAGLVGHYLRGAYYPKGGGQSIADALAGAIEHAGGTIHLRHPVERILVRSGRAIGVRLAARGTEPAREVQASVVVSNADMRRTLLELVGPEHLPGDWVVRAPRFEMSAGMFITFLGIRGDVRDRGMGATNFWQFDDWDIDRVFRDASELRIRACYLTSATTKDPENALHYAPAGVSNCEVMAIVPGTGAAWGASDDDADAWRYGESASYQARKKRIEDELVARVDMLLPGAAADVVFRESATPVTHRRFTGATDGAAYGLAQTPEQMFRGRPGYRGPIDGLYLCGASTRAGHGVLGTMTGGRRAALRIEREAARQSALLRW